jgi:hypothetical protein
VENKHIHTWETSCKLKEYKDVKYNKPIVEHKEEPKKSINLFKKVK